MTVEEMVVDFARSPFRKTRDFWRSPLRRALPEVETSLRCRTRTTAFLLVLTLCLTFLAGCSRFHTDYGESKGITGKQSVNGFAALRELLEAPPASTGNEVGSESQELKTRDLVRLSSRAEKLDAIVWIAQSWPPMNELMVRKWMNRWLQKKDRTVVFVVPDGGSTEVYFREAAELAIPGQRFEYRRRLAQQINDRLLDDESRSSVRVEGWFEATAMPYRMFLDDRRVVDYDLADDATQIVAENKNPGDQDSDGEDMADDDTQSEVDEEELFAEINALLEDESEDSDADVDASSDRTSFQSLLQETIDLGYSSSDSNSFDSDSRKLTTLARVRDENWSRSQVLVVASGGLLTNFAMTGQKSTALAEKIRAEIRDVSGVDQLSKNRRIEVGFLSSDEMPIPISNASPGAPKSTGMEVLTTWPLSLVTMHGLFLGVVMCLMLLPAFGRPRNVRHNRTTHFGNHLSAMATLMRRNGGGAGGVMFAKRKISQYLRVVRGETAGPWVLEERVLEERVFEDQVSEDQVLQNSDAPETPLDSPEPATVDEPKQATQVDAADKSSS